MNQNEILPVDIKENELPVEILATLLLDRTLTKRNGRETNISWCTDGYVSLGREYASNKEIRIGLVTGENSCVITPRVKKSKEIQDQRVKDKAEVFTPSWVCNAQNNLIDEAWFGRKNVFNTEIVDDAGNHSWKTTKKSVTFPKDKTWKDYVRDTRMEITCGEAPYITSRYDATTGEPIAVENRIGLLDRKLRVISENVDDSSDWLEWAQVAYKNIYGYDWQGDNVLLSRESLFCTFLEAFIKKFGKQPQMRSQKSIAEIISWNIWQMDGLKFVIPESCHDEGASQQDLFSSGKIQPCPGCAKDNVKAHNGVYCLVRDWPKYKAGSPDAEIRFVDLIKNL